MTGVMETRNIFDTGGSGTGEEFFPLLEGKRFRLERIMSRGQPTPEGEWYDQAQPEWVMLARGEAELVFQDGTRAVLQAADWLLIPAGVRHRVERVSDDAVWLALHFEA